jgi:hypothetical protein
MIRITLIILALVLLTLVLLPFQLAGILFDSRLQRIVPRLFHRAVSAIVGIRIQETRQRATA